MKTHLINSKYSKFLLLFLFTSLLLFIFSCSSGKLQIAEFSFNHNGNKYLVRSAYCPNNPKSCNHLIGKDFVAVDINQDRIMDKVTKGEVQLSEVQKIYEFCLNQLEEKGNITEITKRNNEFVLVEPDYTFVLRSFSTQGNPFNEFKINSEKNKLNNSIIALFIDRNADGILNEFIKGGILIENAQQMYNRTIQKGLEQEKLYRVNGNILVK